MKRILTYVFFLSAVLISRADNWVRDTEPAILEVHYTRTEVTDTTKRDTDFYKEETMLRIGSGMSRYCSVPHYNRDSLMYCAPDLYWQMERASFEKDPKEHDRTVLSRSGRYWSVIYKNYPEGKITETDYFDMEDWRYEEDWEKPEWELTDDTKEILGYQCFRATADYRGRKWTAWFAPEIPIQDGPWKLCGLPGLIIEAHDAADDYHFTASGLKQSGIADVGFLVYKEKRGVTKVTRDKYLNNWWRYKNSDFASKIRAAYGVGPDTSGEKQKVNYDREETDYPHDL